MSQYHATKNISNLPIVACRSDDTGVISEMALSVLGGVVTLRCIDNIVSQLPHTQRATNSMNYLNYSHNKPRRCTQEFIEKILNLNTDPPVFLK